MIAAFLCLGTSAMAEKGLVRTAPHSVAVSSAARSEGTEVIDAEVVETLKIRPAGPSSNIHNTLNVQNNTVNIQNNTVIIQSAAPKPSGAGFGHDFSRIRVFGEERPAPRRSIFGSPEAEREFNRRESERLEAEAQKRRAEEERRKQFPKIIEPEEHKAKELPRGAKIETWDEQVNIRSGRPDPWKAKLTGYKSGGKVTFEAQQPSADIQREPSKPLELTRKNRMALRSSLREALRFQKFHELDRVENPPATFDSIGQVGPTPPVEFQVNEKLAVHTPVRVTASEGTESVNSRTVNAEGLAREVKQERLWNVVEDRSELRSSGSAAPIEDPKKQERDYAAALGEAQVLYAQGAFRNGRDLKFGPGGKWQFTGNTIIRETTKWGQLQEHYQPWMNSRNILVTPAYRDADGNTRADIVGLAAFPIGSTVRITNVDMEKRSANDLSMRNHTVSFAVKKRTGSIQGSIPAPGTDGVYRIEVVMGKVGDPNARVVSTVGNFKLPDPRSEVVRKNGLKFYGAEMVDQAAGKTP